MATYTDSRSTALNEAEIRDIRSLYNKARRIVGVMRGGLNEDDAENAASVAYEHIEAAKKLAEVLYRLVIRRGMANDQRNARAKRTNKKG